MKVTVIRRGGLGGLQMRGELNTNTMSEAEANALKGLVHIISFDWPDQFQYDVSVTLDDGTELAIDHVSENLIEEGSPLHTLIKRAMSNIVSNPPLEIGLDSDDAPFCNTCGHITVRNGAVFKCLNCGTTMP